MLPYIYGSRGGIHIINLEHTIVALRRAVGVAREVARQGGNVVFVGSRLGLHKLTVAAVRQANWNSNGGAGTSMEDAHERSSTSGGGGGAFFVTRWIPGTITNRTRILRRSVNFDPDKVTQDLTPTTSSDTSFLLEQQQQQQPLQKKQPYVEVPDLLIILDMRNNSIAIAEARQQGVPVIAICDTDCDPRDVAYPIPANDDSIKGVELVAGLLGLAVRRGREDRKRG